MESDLQQHSSMFLNHQHQQQQPQISSGLTRYRSAPSSYFTNVIDRDFYERIFYQPSSPEKEGVFSRIMNSLGSSGEDSLAQNLSPVRQNSAVKEEIIRQGQAMPSMNNEHVVLQQYQSNMNNPSTSSAPQNVYQSSARPPLPNQGHTLGYAAMRGMGTFGACTNTSEEARFYSARRLENQPNYSSGLMSSIAENNRENNPNNEAFGESHGNDFMAGLIGDWDDSAVISDSIPALKIYGADDVKPFSSVNAAEAQNETAAGQPPAPLTHQFSLPNTSAEMAAIEKFLRFSDSVPCKIRAKRGCATHPRSIAERVRKTKISERMRKLQDLVPNMEKQTNTSDMLDLAVDYIKDLQKQVQTLSDCQAKCTCSHKQQQ